MHIASKTSWGRQATPPARRGTAPWLKSENIGRGNAPPSVKDPVRFFERERNQADKIAASYEALGDEKKAAYWRNVAEAHDSHAHLTAMRRV